MIFPNLLNNLSAFAGGVFWCFFLFPLYKFSHLLMWLSLLSEWLEVCEELSEVFSGEGMC